MSGSGRIRGGRRVLGARWAGEGRWDGGAWLPFGDGNITRHGDGESSSSAV